MKKRLEARNMKRLISVFLIFYLFFSSSLIAMAKADDGENLKGEAALAYYTEHLDDSDIDAYEKMGTLYREGLDGINRNYQTAIEWYQKGIDAGKVPSIAGLGYMYMRGFGIVRDYEKAMALFQQAAELDNGRAMYLIGTMYELGLSVDKNDETALEWYQKAADAGYDEARLKIGQYYLYIAGDVEKGLELLNAAAEEGIASAYSYLGDYYYKAESPAAAKTWYEQGAELGDDNSIGMIGYMYDTGNGAAKSYTQSIEWYEKAAAMGNTNAMRNLAFLYYAGMFGNAKPDRAKNYFTEAAARGDTYSLWAIAYRFQAKPATGYDSSKDETTRALELYGKALVCGRDEDNREENAWPSFYENTWGESDMMEYIDGMVVNHVCTREESDAVINEQVEYFRLDFAKEN